MTSLFGVAGAPLQLHLGRVCGLVRRVTSRYSINEKEERSSVLFSLYTLTRSLVSSSCVTEIFEINLRKVHGGGTGGNPAFEDLAAHAGRESQGVVLFVCACSKQ